MLPQVDLSLAQRLERAEATSNASFVEARRQRFPASNASWIDVGGCYAMFDGTDSPLTQSFGLGLFSYPNQEDWNRLESFFISRHATIYHEISPLAPPSLLEDLRIRHYAPLELTSILYRSTELAPAIPNPNIQITLLEHDSSLATPNQLDAWADTSAQGWAHDAPALIEFIRQMGQVYAAKSKPLCFLASIDHIPVGTAAMHLHEGVAILAGASTLPPFRRRGVQTALLHARLHYAALQNCDLVMMGALPGSRSQFNAERCGFQIAYTRIKWQKFP